VICFDTNYPKDVALENVTITVNRNPNPPRFANATYSATISDTFPLVTEVLKVSATDPDGVSNGGL